LHSLDGRRIRCLTIVDDCTRESLTIEVDFGLSGERVTHVLGPRPVASAMWEIDAAAYP
jgi:hypothetical protein